MITAKDARRGFGVRRILPSLLILSVLLAGNAEAQGWLDRLKGVFGGSEQQSETLGAEEVRGGLKEALLVGTENVVGRLGATDGFNLDPAVHIPLPGQLEQVRSYLGKIGMDSSLADLELRLNRAAEIATPKAKALFVDAIREMTLDDAMGILRGPDDAATQYFRSKMSGPLGVEMKPVVDESLADAGVVQAYDSVMGRYNAIPFAPKVDADLSDYVVQKGMDGIFYYLAKEEAAIRSDPAARTTELLRRVFGQ